MTVATWELRARFAAALSELYGREVPAYTTLVEVSEAVNRDYIRAHGEEATRLGSVERVTAERHGAIRVGSPKELSQAARVFAAFGMYPVGFYDLRDAAKASVPVVSTAFRPIDEDELAKNPFRVFTSMLATDDPRFFSPEIQQRLDEFIGARTLFPEDLLELADRAAAAGGLEENEADQLVEKATKAFQLSDDPVDHEWYRTLENISAVAADIGGVTTTHINHLTPRVLDIDDLYNRMEARGITMIDEVQGPPKWKGPDVLLRQTSFRALDEERIFSFEDGTIGPGTLRVRFGEVEQRGIALTPKGRDLYDQLIHEAYREPDRWAEVMPTTEEGLRQQQLAYFTYEKVGEVPAGTSLDDAIAQGLVVATPIVYEDFLPRSAAGIFQSNLKDEGTRDDGQHGTDYDIDVLSKIIGKPIHDPFDLYAAQQQRSLDALGI
ncbi:2-oxoadipate dioxygenase/decarboxylase [Corynebacterium aquilae]|uniref:2-oxoadipate dioxygenase/decarboxylase n=1 Tax=Corynebacterium aquilae DSM 44791 TaxID=1431546 RepID=A0A1L7CFJ0_9CORY|nr:VOC family protein [Corynebacterium aquilae]APT84598.1 hypothetical protein CAQU_05420 [Corynebacterium aquilae DSM 44791]